jgi:hypothetical protein
MNALRRWLTPTWLAGLLISIALPSAAVAQ